MTDTFDITQQPTAGGNTNAPASGTYGEKAALARLQQSFPATSPGAGPSVQPDGPAPMMSPSPGQVSTAPAGLPAGLLAPTQRPDVPAFTPPSVPGLNPVQSAQTDRQRNLAALDALVHDPNVSPLTREWAQNFIDKLISRSVAR